jgi:hypothetical protein
MILAAVSIMGQENAPPGFLHGGLVNWTGTPRGGQFTFYLSAGQLYVCSYDEKTYIERENRRISMAATEQGDRLEIVSDRRPNSTLCYARTIHILEDPRAHFVPGVKPRPRAESATPVPMPHTNLTLTGAVYHIAGELLILRSPSGDHQTVLLRPDTRYLCEGQTTDAASLAVNTVVFVRVEKNLRDEVEANQVIWGGILQPEQ